ncbi:MAG: hypothetical protein LBL34_03130, partial [Clostridiales bacterium]|nr:hypothetical protein [Clostridiales bacterium]
TISVIVDNAENHNATLTVDGQNSQLIANDSKIIVKVSEHKTKLVRTQNNTFYETLKRKMKI